MVPPGDIGALPIWVGVYLALILVSAVSGYVFYQRVFRLVMQGKGVARFDRPLVRFGGALVIVLGQSRVLQRVRYGDWAGLGHAIIFWGFLSFSLSYAIFIFGGSIWRDFPEKLLTSTGVRVYSSFLEITAALLLVMLGWALVRRWVVKPHRLSFDLTRNLDSVIVVGLIAGLMVSTILTHAFYVALGGEGPESEVLIGGVLGDWFTDLGVGTGLANTLQAVFWWTHLAIILGFAVYIPFSKHMHMVASPLNAFFRSLEPRGALPAIDLENTEKFGAGRVQDFTWKQLLDGYACAVCGRCTDVCPANLTGKILSPMHIVENLKDHMVAIGHQGARDPEHVEPVSILG
ncbi:MAG: (Fe-S)-binding protein, partial [Chloroflexi bacterium]|nr:(Fe-S)-binding protein [Chloroflexota bacterium]